MTVGIDNRKVFHINISSLLSFGLCLTNEFQDCELVLWRSRIHSLTKIFSMDPVSERCLTTLSSTRSTGFTSPMRGFVARRGKKSPRVADKFVQFLTLSVYQLELISPHRPLIASRTTVVSIRALGGMFRASGLLLARSSKMVFIPSSNGYGRSGRILNW